jgi:hypothetical protein
VPEAPPYQRGLAALASPHWGRWAAALREGVVAAPSALSLAGDCDCYYSYTVVSINTRHTKTS